MGHHTWNLPIKSCLSTYFTVNLVSAIYPSTAAGQHKLLQHVFRRHLKPKKQHEVARLAIVAGQVARAACRGVMVDVGSGQGHLSRLLAYGHNVRVVSLEAEDKFIEGARWEELEKDGYGENEGAGEGDACINFDTSEDLFTWVTVLHIEWGSREKHVCTLYEKNPVF